ncbi:YwiC-like family protein [Streptomyces sp. HUAS TT20]|uniref:YwiC-like family protein n=1 Tax=Streptomyces sp. HUAS TT20 TaxID=3447509 RepID=UPI0021D9437B|nr:YwiC-like family protein [Streptomyces sp. HUAS 15-9]UXY28505.1 YwiC-like family protein [Streptomyces sp. HUAS 15-9]
MSPQIPPESAGTVESPGTARTAGPRSAPVRRRRRRGRWMPPQHGAWAMLLVPYLAGLIAVGFSWVQIPLLLGWVGGYLLSYFGLLAIKTRRLSRVRTQLLVYGSITLTAGVTVLLARPQILLFAPVFAAVLAVNGLFAKARRDRALGNGLVSVVAATLILPVVAVAGEASPWQVTGTSLVTLLYFTGSLLFVRTTIRARGSHRLMTASLSFHAAALLAAAWLALPYALPFTGCLLRAAALPRRGLTPKQIGIVEIFSSFALLATVIWVAV